MARWSRSIDWAGGLAGAILGLLVALPAVPVASGAVPVGAEHVGSGPAAVFSVTIAASPTMTEPGVSVEFLAEPIGGAPPFSYAWTDSQGGGDDGANHSVVPSAPGNVSATVTVVDAAGARAAATFTEPVAMALELGLSAPNVTEVGLPFSTLVTASGGIPPYRLEVAPEGGTAINETAPGPGTYSVTLASSVAGWITAVGSVQDSLGTTRSTTAVIAYVADLPHWTVANLPASVEVGPTYAWWLALDGGSGLLRWSVTWVGPVLNVSAINGTSPSPGELLWSAAFAAAGNYTLRFAGTDANGVAFPLTLGVHVAPPLAAFATILSGGASRAPELNLTVLGGVPPYTFELGGPGAAMRLVNASGPGSVTWPIDVSGPDAWNLSVRVSDAAGGIITTAIGVPGTPPGGASPAPDGGSWELPALLAVLGILLVGGLTARRYLAHRPEPAGPGVPVVPAIEEVRQMLEETDTVERETLHLLGEERGLDRGAVEAGIAHWLASGRIESLRGAGGEELLRWRDAPIATPEEDA